MKLDKYLSTEFSIENANTNSDILKAHVIETPPGSMIAIANEKKLFLLEFVDSKNVNSKINKIKKTTNFSIVVGKSMPIISIEKELKQYFKGKLKKFTTPLHFIGTDFQKNVWKKLKTISHGKIKSYGEIAEALGKPTAFRAVALANAANQHAIIVPCHRVINANGKMGGYAGGIDKKKWLLDFENEY